MVWHQEGMFGIVLNMLKEELLEARGSHFPAFLIGAALYTTLLIAL